MALNNIWMIRGVKFSFGLPLRVSCVNNGALLFEFYIKLCEGRKSFKLINFVN